MKIFKSLIFYLLILVFFIAFNFTDTPLPPSGWYQQFITVLNGQSINDMTFTDSLNGYAVTNYTNGHSYILKTSNSGDNWGIIYDGSSSNYLLKKVKFLNQNTGFVCGGIIENYIYHILKTTNGGLNWYYINAPFQSVAQEDMSVLNEDTIWTVFSESLTGGVYFTSNGGASWEQQLFLGSSNPDHIYMYNGRIGFISENGNYVRKTTDGGQSWTITSNNDGFTDMYFVDSLTGWKCWGEIDSIKHTANGGLNWTKQILPLEGISGGNCLFYSRMLHFAVLNRDTLLGVGGVFSCTGYNYRGIIYRTTNGGNLWLYQIPDTQTVTFPRYTYISFVNNINGWAYGGSYGIHTTTGGDPIWYTGILQTPNAVPEGFVLKQNYPNPFNPRTVIPYSLSASAHVKIIAYDITGREVQSMVDSYQQVGAYEVDFMGKFTASGVYFYRMTVDGNVVGTRKMILIK